MADFSIWALAIFFAVFTLTFALVHLPRPFEPLRYGLLSLTLAASTFCVYLALTGHTLAWFFASLSN